ncbi:MAG: type II toxin-antitoxin system VapC family toxin [Methanomassiliicoccaceae archaeon]|nr:type II toxin-antitoxin system VapC family toxin [Methanomassiliicoccaceae archaeon]
MIYCFDTGFVLSALKGKIPDLKERMSFSSPKFIKVPSMVAGELLAAAGASRDTDRNTGIVRSFLAPYEVIPFDYDASMVYGKISAELEKKGKTMGTNDLMIVATVMSRGGILITDRKKEFACIEGLQIEDWSKRFVLKENLDVRNELRP